MVDYSRWNRIEISDDEDDTHPNIDTGSLFRWRHQARLERMEKHRLMKEELSEKQKKLTKKFSQTDLDPEERKKLDAEKQKLEKEAEELEKKEKLQPWNVDTISHDSWSKTLVNRNCLQEPDVKDDENEEITDEHVNLYAKFVEKYETQIRDFAFHSRFEDCRKFLLKNPQLACRHTLDYMMLWCLHLKLDGKTSLLEHVSRQAVIIQILLDLAKTVRGDPRDCLPMFFTKAKKNFKKFQQFWEDSIEDFRQRVNKAAEMRIDRAVEEQIESQEKLIGPGGLDAQEVFDSLPKELQDCFLSRDVEMLEDILSKMEPEEAEYYMKQCVDAGLWNPNKSSSDDEDEILLRKISERNDEDGDQNSARREKFNWDDDDDEDEDEEEIEEVVAASNDEETGKGDFEENGGDEDSGEDTKDDDYEAEEEEEEEKVIDDDDFEDAQASLVKN